MINLECPKLKKKKKSYAKTLFDLCEVVITKQHSGL